MSSLPKRKMIEEKQRLGVYDLEGTLSVLVGRLREYPDNAELSVDTYEEYGGGSTTEFVIEWTRPETDEEYDARCAKWLKDAPKRAAAKAKQKARLEAERIKREEEDRKTLERLKAKYEP